MQVEAVPDDIVVTKGKSLFTYLDRGRVLAYLVVSWLAFGGITLWFGTGAQSASTRITVQSLLGLTELVYGWGLIGVNVAAQSYHRWLGAVLFTLCLVAASILFTIYI